MRIYEVTYQYKTEMEAEEHRKLMMRDYYEYGTREKEKGMWGTMVKIKYRSRFL